jgi:ribonuclease E
MRTSPHDDDSWSDLAAELGVDSTAHPNPTPSRVEPESEHAGPKTECFEPEATPGEPADVIDAEPDDTVVIPALQSEPLAESPEEPGGEPAGPGRKRRRRRRRRKKGGQPAEANGPVEAGTSSEADDDSGEFDDEAEAEEEGETVAAEEAAPEAARDIIVNWNVPSWEEIVAGLYRPER